ncbi:Interleukin-1 receptor-associated kinase 1-binding protein 1 [Holothuria leucospilota]|uniref:Interleukin-1 receptor-associated kinase 1-binding protein 1 n=1 Tax=Holothuria leucospilota TaxID=206669 RepID=A0A9Q0YSH8_HOLLE|nr:Interleukin-1 receptor-associated kinase 1-binding protein 1 [Holothuria leucospilota]
MDLKSSRVFASHVGDNISNQADEREDQSKRLIDVWAIGTVTLKPDRAKVNFIVSTSQGKETAADAKNSVSRRADYVIQTLHTHNVKEGDVISTSSLTRSDGLFHVVTEISVIFTDFTKCQNVCNFLVEKLDDSVHISQPHFFHGTQNLNTVRREACMQATRNAHQKASEIARFLRQSLGAPIVIREEETKEWDGPPAHQDTVNGHHSPLTFQQRLANAVFNVSTKVHASFEILSRDKGKEIKT